MSPLSTPSPAVQTECRRSPKETCSRVPGPRSRVPAVVDRVRGRHLAWQNQLVHAGSPEDQVVIFTGDGDQDQARLLPGCDRVSALLSHHPKPAERRTRAHSGPGRGSSIFSVASLQLPTSSTSSPRPDSRSNLFFFFPRQLSRSGQILWVQKLVAHKESFFGRNRPGRAILTHV